MLSVLASLCLGCQADLSAPDPLAFSPPSVVPPLIQPSYWIAGPYELNPGLHKPTDQPDPLQQNSSPVKQPPQSPSVIVPTSQSEAGPQGGAAFPTDVNLQPEESDFPQSHPSTPAPVPSNSPLLIISPTARPSGPVPRPQDIPAPASIPPQDAFQGGITTPAEPESSPLVRPSGPRPYPAPQSQIMTPSSQTIQQGNPSIPSPVETAPRYRSLPLPSRQPNISPASQPVVVQEPIKPPIQSISKPLDVPVNLPIQPPQITPPTRPPSEVAPIGAADGPQVSFIVLENSTTDFQLDFDEFGRENLTLEEVVSFRVRNGDLITFTTGVNTLRLEGSEPVQNIPLILGWESEIGEVAVKVSAGAEVFNRLDPQPYFKVGTQTSVFGRVIVSGEVEHGPYKFNAATLENEISFLRFRPSIFWQIDEQTTFFGLFQAGFFNDGNQEIQSFSRLERKIGPFSVAANVFTWNFAEDLEAESGYFSPLSFLLYNAEVGWKGKLFDPLTCQFAASIGNQVVNGGRSTGRGLQAKCTASLADNVELDFGYVLTNIISSGSGASNSQIFSGQLRIDF